MAQDVGIKISKPNYDATTAADSDLLFSSSWPSLPIVNEYTKTISSLPYTTTIPHGLGYVPFVLGWSKTSGKWHKRFFGYNDGIKVDETNIYINITDNYPFVTATTTTAPTSLHLKVYALDIATEVEYELSARSSIVAEYNPDYGIKIAKEAADINSTDMRDFILHSRCQSPLILALKNENSAVASGSYDGLITYEDPQGQISWVFGFIRATDGKYREVPYYGQAYPTTQIDTATKTYTLGWINAAGDEAASLVVLRDPMFAASDITASY